MKSLIIALLLGLLIPTPQLLAITMDEALQSALQNHQRIEQSRAGRDLSEAELGSARAAFLPQVDLDYAYRKSQQDPQLLGKQSSTLSLGASLNLFNGLADFRNYQAAQQRTSAAAFLLQATIADITLETRQAFIEVLRAQRAVITASEGVALLERQKRDAELQLKYGVIARHELLRVEVELSSARQDLLQEDGNGQIARRQLERLIGKQLSEAEELDEQSVATRLGSNWGTAEQYQPQLLNDRSELNYLRHLLQAAQFERNASNSAYLPSIDLSVSHEEYGDSLAPNGRSNSYDDDNLLMLRANWNLFDGFSKGQQVAAATARTRAIAASLRDTEAALLLQLETALQNSRIATGRQQEARTGVTSAEENYRVTENRFAQQQATTVDLLDAQFLLTRSRNLASNARYDSYLSAAQLERILERAND